MSKTEEISINWEDDEVERDYIKLEKDKPIWVAFKAGSGKIKPDTINEKGADGKITVKPVKKLILITDFYGMSRDSIKPSNKEFTTYSSRLKGAIKHRDEEGTLYNYIFKITKRVEGDQFSTQYIMDKEEDKAALMLKFGGKTGSVEPDEELDELDEELGE